MNIILVISTLVIVIFFYCCWSFKCMVFLNDKYRDRYRRYWPCIYLVSDRYQNLQNIIYTSHFCKSIFLNEIDNECLSQAVMLALSTAARGTCWWGRITADGDHASVIYCFSCSSRMCSVEFSVEFNSWICGGEFVKRNKMDRQLPVEYYRSYF